ncbi:MAG: hypothetical protein HRU70_08200 [Phycisphaeraceae bacterium]|nr:MAG: hypothetical protein HRU70_08200 [Phycisphaeraceae bacterium]
MNSPRSFLRPRAGFRHGLRVSLAFLAAGAALSVSGCCSDSDKKSLQEMIDRANDRNFKACDTIPDPTLRAACITNAQNQQTALVTAYANYLSACATGSSQRIKEALDALKELLKPLNRPVIGALGMVVNSEMVLGKDESVCFSIELRSEGSIVPQDYVIVNDRKYLPEAAGNAALAADQDKGLAVATAPGDFQANGRVTYAVVPGSTMCLTASGMTLTGTVEGSLSISSTAVDTSGAYAPTDARLVINLGGSTYAMTLDTSCMHNAMTLDADGRGTLAMRVHFVSTGSAALPARLPEGAWMVLPVERNASATQLRIGNGGSLLSGLSVFPTLPNPIADFDRDGLVDDADLDSFLRALADKLPAADVNRDGVADSLDYEMFLDRWSNWSQP